jgi:hypothetical protein
MVESRRLPIAAGPPYRGAHSRSGGKVDGPGPETLIATTRSGRRQGTGPIEDSGEIDMAHASRIMRELG